ncbi:MAG: hypothetical protein ACOC5B_04755, partial [Myxococcota bacterium]
MRDGTIRYRARVSIHGKSRSLGVYDTETDAWEVIDAYLALHYHPEPEVLTLATWGPRWLDRRELDGFHRSTDNDRSRWRNWLEGAPFYDWPLARIERRHVVEWVRGLMGGQTTRVVREGRDGHRRIPTGRPPSRTTVKHALNLLRKCIGDAADAGHVA